MAEILEPMISNYAHPVNRLPSDLIEEIVKDAKTSAQRSGSTPYVAFDADGTLWLKDASEVFFNYQIKHGLVELPEAPWDYYNELKAKNPRDAFSWLAQILQGHTVQEIKSWAKQSYTEVHLLPFEDIKNLLAAFDSEGIENWVVTASVQWPVEAAIELYELPVTGVIGVTTEIIDGKITDQRKLPVTWREGKAQAIQSVKPSSRPLFCAGNTPGDVFLMELSQQKPLALQSHKKESGLKNSELRLKAIAKERGWRTHSF